MTRGGNLVPGRTTNRVKVTRWLTVGPPGDGPVVFLKNHGGPVVCWSDGFSEKTWWSGGFERWSGGFGLVVRWFF